MVVDITRLLLGLMILSFHRPIADFIMDREREIDGFFRSRGIRLPAPPSDAIAHNLYFGLGAFLCVVSMLRIWLAIH